MASPIAVVKHPIDSHLECSPLFRTVYKVHYIGHDIMAKLYVIIKNPIKRHLTHISEVLDIAYDIRAPPHIVVIHMRDIHLFCIM